MKCLSYKDFINQELDRASKRNLTYTSNHISYLKFAKKIKRRNMLDISVDVYSSNDII